MDSGMIVLLLVLGGVIVYMLFSPTSLVGPWLDRHCKKEREEWSSEDVEDTLIQSVNADIEVPPKPKKKKPKKKRVYKRRKKK
jgi:hypothetical protein